MRFGPGTTSVWILRWKNGDERQWSFAPCGGDRSRPPGPTAHQAPILADYNIYLGGGADVYLWAADMFSTLAALPPPGATLPADEYERHKAAYRAILGRRENGIDLIEDGVVFEHVRLCQMENGVVGGCAVR
jgi:hypothetical protein